MIKETNKKSVAMAPGKMLYIVSALTGLIHRWTERRNVDRVLIFKLDQLGDLLIATPALRSIRARFPHAEIRIVVGEWNTALLESNPSVDVVHVYNSDRFCRLPNKPHAFAHLRKQLGAWRPDLIIGLRDDWHTLMYSMFTSAARVERGGAHIVEFTERARSRQSRYHEIERLWRTLAPLGIKREADTRLEYVVTDDERVVTNRFIETRGIVAPFAMIHAGATQPLREWPVERYAAIARHINRRWGMQIVLLGVDRERDRSRALAELISDLNPVDVTGQLGLRATAALMAEAGLYLGSDGGAMHLAAAVNIPTVGLFGPGSFHVFSPIGPRTVGISKMFPCSPCAQVDCIRPHDTCMMAILLDEVAQAIDGLLGAPSARSSEAREDVADPNALVR